MPVGSSSCYDLCIQLLPKFCNYFLHLLSCLVLYHFNYSAWDVTFDQMDEILATSNVGVTWDKV